MIRLRDTESLDRKEYTRGTHRVCRPAETLHTAQPLMWRLGITRIANLTGLDTVGLPVYAAYRPLARSVVTSMGKGVDPSAAKASALMESIELWHAEWMPGPGRWASCTELVDEGVPVLDIGRLPVARGGTLDLDEQRGWVRGHDLVSDAPVWVPHETVSMNLVARPGESPGLLRTSNGLASGNHVLEATAHGLCEVVERDADAVWRASAEVGRLDLATVTDPDALAVLERLTAAGVRTAVWDITSDVGVPTYGCTILADPRSCEWRSLGVHEGAGCHPCPAVALTRALTEAAQVRLACVSGTREDIDRIELSRANDRDVAEGIWAELDQLPATEKFRTSTTSATTLAADVRGLVTSLTERGIRQIAVVELTRPDIGVPVVKVLVPGLAGPAGDCETGVRGGRR